MIFRKTPTFAVLQTALRSDFSSLPLFKGLHYYGCGKFTFPARGRAPRQIVGLFRKVRFSETQVIILIIMRKSKNDTFCFFTQFGNALPYGKRVNLRPYILCVPLKGRKEGENAVSRKARGGVALKSRKNDLSAQIIFREPKQFKARLKTTLFKKRTQFAACLRSQRVNAARMIWCALKKRAAEGRALKLTEKSFISLKLFS